MKNYFRKNWLLILIFSLAGALRLWDISGRAIFFDDAAFDMFSGMKALQDGQVPLLGIASSLPRFHQGPVTVWMNMVLGATFGFNLLAFSLFFVSLSLGALLLVYFFCERYLNKRIALGAVFLIALSPLAIAQARMPYHTNPIPLATILYLISLVRLWQKKKWSLFWATLSWAFLFQFELAVFPTFVLIPYVLFRTKNLQNLKRKFSLAVAGLSIGLAPQIIFDFKNNFSQLGLFVVWVGYRLSGVFVGEHQMDGGKLRSVVGAFTKYGGRIWSVDYGLIQLVFWGLVLLAFYRLVLEWKKRKKIKPGLEVVGVFALVLSLGYTVHGGPSEAYFPPFIILLPILVSFILSEFFKKQTIILVSLLLVWGVVNIWGIFKFNFFVSNPQEFSYHYSVAEQREIIDFIDKESGGDFVLDTTGENKKFESSFDNLRWLGAEKNIWENKNSENVFYIERKNSVLQNDSGLSVEHFVSADVYYEK